MSIWDFIESYIPLDGDEERLLEALKNLLSDIDQVEPIKRAVFVPQNIWDMLAGNGQYDMIEKLQHVEAGTEGFGTMVVRNEGFSDEDDIHNAVLDWLRAKSVNIFNPAREIALLEDACIWR